MATSTTSENRTAVRGLGEIALRVNNLDAMQKEDFWRSAGHAEHAILPPSC
jgi:hypothetical protein